MTIESQLEQINTNLLKVIDLLQSPHTSLPNKTTEKTSASGSSVEKSETPPTASTKPQSSQVVEEVEKVNPTATEVLKKEAVTQLAAAIPGISFSDISTGFFEYLAHARDKLGRDGAKTVARQMLDTFQSEKGKPLDVNFLAEDQYAEFHANILAATEAVTSDG